MLDCAESEKEGVQGVQGVQEASKTHPAWDTPPPIPVHHQKNTGVQDVQLISQLDGNERACTPCTPLENLPCTPIYINEIDSQHGFTPLSTPCTLRTPEKTHLNNLTIDEQNFFGENSCESGESVNGSDSLSK
jgi:hypothetical protein